MDVIIRSTRPVLALLAMACLGADEYRPSPRFAGESIPDPPRQKEPWTPPRTGLPRFLVAATATLFEQGVADPRGCTYREVEVGDNQIVKTRGFVLPAREGESGRFAIGWDGLLYPAFSIGPAVDLGEDIRALATSLKGKPPGAVLGTPRHSAGRLSPFGRGGPTDPEDWSPMKVCLLLRLGRVDLAETLFAAATPWKPEARGRDLTDYQISYYSLARDWASSAFVRLAEAHKRGDDVVALDAARRLSTFARAAETTAEAMGFPRPQTRFGDPPSYFPFLRQVPALLADQERRALEPPRGPIPPRGGNPSARIAALMRDLDQIAAQVIVNGGASTRGAALEKELAAEGDAAVEPLLAAIENDTRLTRTVSYGRGMSIDRFVHPVWDTELDALIDILQTAEFNETRMAVRSADLDARKALARTLRAFWMKNRAVPPNERWYRMLRDDAAGRARWMEAASRIIQPKDSPDPIGVGDSRLPRPDTSPMMGEALRGRRDPGVTELMSRRVADIARSSNPSSDPVYELSYACSMAVMLDRWDEKASLPVIRTLMARCRAQIEQRRAAGSHGAPGLASYLALFTTIRMQAGEREALDDYAAWVRDSTPEELAHQSLDVFEPLWTYPEHPAVRDAARRLFDAPGSPWVAMLRAPGSQARFFFRDGTLWASPLVRLAPFRAALIAAMADRTALGTVHRDEHGMIVDRRKDGSRGGVNALRADLEGIKAGEERPFRAGDDVARQVSAIEGAPRIELYWPEDRRDRAVREIAAFLRTYADRFTTATPDGRPESMPFDRNRAHLAFPILDRPATREDVRAARAIFSLDGEGEARLARVPPLPFKARWLNLNQAPIDANHADGTTRREYDRDGWIWQAEEVRKGDRWERSFGFVGPHAIARVPAAEIELSPGRFAQAWGQLEGGLDVRIEPVEPHSEGYEPGRPILVKARIRNRRGVEGTTPTEFLRRGADGRPSLRRGVSPTAFEGPGFTTVELRSKRTDHFEPGPATRPLGAFESFDAMTIDLGDWFDFTRPGSYRVRLGFAAESGAGQGSSNDWSFTVREGGGPRR